RRTRRATVAAALLLAGGGLAHPEFFLVAVAVLVATASWSWRDGREPLGAAPHARADAGRVLAALGGSVALVLGGLLACLIGPARLAGDTSLDGMLRRTGQWAELRSVYADRLVQNWRRYAPFMTTALAVAGGVRVRGFAPPMRDWRAQQTYVSPDELYDLTYAGRIASTTPPGTPLVFVADDPSIDDALFRLSHGLNMVRAAVPPDRAADVLMFLGRPQDLVAGRPTQRGDPVYDRASADSLAHLPEAP